MVEPHEASELPELSDEAEEKSLDEIGDLTVRTAETDELRTLLMWKSVAAENIKQRDRSPDPPQGVTDLADTDLGEIQLTAAPNKKDKLRLLEYYVSEKVL